MNDGVAGESRRKQDFHLGPASNGLVGELAPVHAGHDDIGEQQVDLGMLVDQF